jgi:hypothetical protein
VRIIDDYLKLSKNAGKRQNRPRTATSKDNTQNWLNYGKQWPTNGFDYFNCKPTY